jgi:hypothetical protein
VHFLGFHQGKEVFPLFFSKSYHAHAHDHDHEHKDSSATSTSYLHAPAQEQEHMLWRSGHEDYHLDGHEDEHFVNFAHK